MRSLQIEFVLGMIASTLAMSSAAICRLNLLAAVNPLPTVSQASATLMKKTSSAGSFVAQALSQKTIPIKSHLMIQFLS